MQVAPRVRLVALPEDDIMRLTSTNVYLVGEGEALLIDTGLGDEVSNDLILQELRAIPAALRYIVITHCHEDHFGGARAIREITGAKIAIHEANAGVLEEEAESLKADVLLHHESVIEVGGASVQIIHTPGHSPGDICLFLGASGVLFTGDTILGVGTVVVDGDMVQYMESLKRLLDYDAQIICPGHGPIVRDAKAKVKEIIDHRNMREQQILAQLAQGRKAPWDMVQALYYDVDPRLHKAAERNVNGHLLKLVQEGRVRKLEKGSETAYELLL